MSGSRLDASRSVVGVILVAAAAAVFFLAPGQYSTAGVIALAVVGLTSIAISRRT